MSWKTNAGMWWSNGTQWLKVSDHGRGPIDESFERIENATRMADGTLRRYTVAKKRTWSASWTNLPSANRDGGMKTVDGGLSGIEMERFHRDFDGAFGIMLRRGSAINKPLPVVNSWPYENDDFYFARVMFTDFSKSIVKRGPVTDLWEVSVTLEEV